MKSGPLFRILFDVIACAAIFFLPWWIGIIIAIIGLFLFDHYLEILFFGFILDSLYSPQSGQPGQIGQLGLWSYIFTSGAFALFIAQIFIKDRLRM